MFKKGEITNPIKPLEALLFGDTLDGVTGRSRRGLPINIQLFANGGSAGEGGSDGNEGGDNGSDGGNEGGGENGADDSKGKDGGSDDGKGKDGDDLEKIIQSRVDRLLAKERKENAAVKKELEKLKKEKMTAEEIKKLEADEKEKELAEKEKELTERENRYTAVKALREVGLDDGSDAALLLVDFLIAGEDTDGDAIKERAKNLNVIVKKLVAAEVERTFKENGRNPKGSGNGAGGGDDKNTSVAKKLGEARAAQDKRSQEILKQYGI